MANTMLLPTISALLSWFTAAAAAVTQARRAGDEQWGCTTFEGSSMPSGAALLSGHSLRCRAATFRAGGPALDNRWQGRLLVQSSSDMAAAVGWRALLIDIAVLILGQTISCRSHTAHSKHVAADYSSAGSS